MPIEEQSLAPATSTASLKTINVTENHQRH